MNHSERENLVGKWIITWVVLGLIGPLGWIIFPFALIAFIKDLMK